MKMYKKIILKTLLTLLAAFAFMLMPLNALRVEAAFGLGNLSSGNGNTVNIVDSDRQDAYAYLIDYKKNIVNLNVNELPPEVLQKIEDIWYEANVYIANNTMKVEALISYVNDIAGKMDKVAAQTPTSYADSQDFLFINNNSLVTSANYGELTTLTLQLINVGKSDVTNVVLSPQESTDPDKWPFEITTASNVMVIPKIPASENIYTAHALTQQATWYFYVRNNAKTGTYPLVFNVEYYRGSAVEKTEITTYIHINGAPGAGELNPSENKKEEDKLSTPRIIVTGFRTDPEVVHAGDTFMLYISVQNTSSETAVSNIQFDLTAASEGEKSENTYAAFLPTSGSATIFVPSIGVGSTTQISIEMTARNDLVQKPYVVALNANYEDSKKNPYQMTSNISIPVKQEARIDTGEVEISPDSIEVGDETNIMFPVYNKGKTTLYNVQVDFIGDSVEGGSTFLGKLEPGATGNVDAMVRGIAPTMDDGIIVAQISYEDDAGHVSYLEKEITLFVSEAFYPEEGLDEYGEGGFDEELDGEDGGKGGKVFWKPIIITIVAVIIIAIIVWRVIASKQKKKRLLRELEDLDRD